MEGFRRDFFVVRSAKKKLYTPTLGRISKKHNDLEYFLLLESCFHCGWYIQTWRASFLWERYQGGFIEP
jgi:hypothetical protein